MSHKLVVSCWGTLYLPTLKWAFLLQDLQDLHRDRLEYLTRWRAALEWAESTILSIRCLVSREGLSHNHNLQRRLHSLLTSPKVWPIFCFDQ